MKILFIHQNFPGQFKFLGPALVKEGHKVFALAIRDKTVKWKGIDVISYQPARATSKEIHPWISDFETKVIRAEAVYRKLLELKEKGLNPDLIVAHPGWGESLLVKNIWPSVKLGIYCEFHYAASGLDTGFDPEFPANEDAGCRMQFRNLNHLLHSSIADAAISPTKFQADTYPESFRTKIEVIHDGVDTKMLCPDEQASVRLGNGRVLNKDSEVVSFVNRNLEPYRGYHIFMRALPDLLSARPKADILIVGGIDVSYGSSPKEGSWKDHFLNEVREQHPESDWSRVHFLGHIPYDQYLSVLRVAKVHVYLTYPFVLSWSLLEAMSVGTAIVASDTGPVREVIQDRITGRMVDFFDAKEISKVTVELLANKAERDKLAAKARQYVIENFDLHSVCLPAQLEWVHSLDRKEPL